MVQTMYPGKINSPATTLSGAFTNGDNHIHVTELSVFPAGPNLAVIGTGDDAVTYLYTDKSAASGAGTLTGVSDIQGTDKDWDAATAIARNFTAYDYDALRLNLDDIQYRPAEVTKEIAFATTDVDAGDNDSVDLTANHGNIIRLRVYADWIAGQQTAYTALINSATTGVGPNDPYIIFDNGTGTTFAAADYVLCERELMKCIGIASATLTKVFSYDANTTSYTDETTDAGNATVNDVALPPLKTHPSHPINDAIYLGHSEPFAGVYLVLGTQGATTGSTIVWEYSQGASSWAALTVTDGSTSFTAAAGNYMISWVPPADWATDTVNSSSQYWVRARCSVLSDVATAPLATQILLAPANAIAVTRGRKGTSRAYHDDNVPLYKANNGIRISFYPNTTRNPEECIFEWRSIMTGKWVTDAAITAGDKMLTLTANPALVTDFGYGDLIMIDDTADEWSRVQAVIGDVANATYDYAIVTIDALSAHDITKSVYRVLEYNGVIPFQHDSGDTLYFTTNIDEKIAGTVNITMKFLMDEFA